jgi:hypothetical protein
VAGVEEEMPCLDRDRYVAIRYLRDSLPLKETPEKRTVFFPFYRDAGHMIAGAMPEKLLDDAAVWIQS